MIFDDIKHEKFHDKRFTKEDALTKYENVTKVFIANRDYLLCRDLCVATIWIAIMYLFLCIFSVINFSFQILEILFAEWILTNIATRSRQKRLAYNVIATDVHTREDIKQNLN